MFSQTQEYALRAVIWLAGHYGKGVFGNAQIAEETAVPVSYLAKVLQELVRSGIVSSRRGAGGGFELLREPDDLTVLDVINAVDPLKRITTCPLGLQNHGVNLCPMHARLDQALMMVQDALGKSTIREVMSQPGRPLPLVDALADPIDSQTALNQSTSNSGTNPTVAVERSESNTVEKRGPSAG